MPRLNCGAMDCRHNVSHCCTRNSIDVGECKNSAAMNEENAEQYKANCKNYSCGSCVVKNEFAKDMITNINDCRNIYIDCSAMDCVYNHRRECHVDHVQIEEVGKKPTCAKCSTYKKRDLKY